MKNIKMGRMRHELNVGSHNGGLDLMVKMKLDGEVVQEFEGHSFLWTFAYGLHGMMHGGGANRLVGNLARDTSNPVGSLEGALEADGDRIDAINNSTPIRISTDFSQFNAVEDGDYVWVWGVRGNTAANGLHRARRINSENIDLYELDNVTPVAGNGAWTGGGYVCIVGFRDLGVDNDGNGYQQRWQPLGSWDLCVGTDNTPVSIRDFGLHNRTGPGTGFANYFSEGIIDISIQTTNKPSSRFTLTKAFTNSSGGPIDVNEVGITRGVYDNFDNNVYERQWECIARDVLPSALTVPNGSTLTVEYEVVANLVPDTQDTETDGTNGGFIDDFISHLRQLSFIEFDGYHANLFRCNSGPGRGTLQLNRNNQPDYDTGIVVGTDQTFVSMTDETLVARIAHGEADGDLFHYGNLVEEDMIVDDANDRCIIEIKRIFENRGSTAVTIKEVGLNANRRRSSDDTVVSQMIARTALESADWYTVNPGEFVQVQYDIVIEA